MAEKRKRSQNFTVDEKDKMVKLVCLFKNIILNKRTDGTTNQAKNEAWINLCSQYNSTGNMYRCVLHRFFELRALRTVNTFPPQRQTRALREPFYLNATQTRSVINLAKKKNLFVMEAVWSRFSPAYTDLERDIRSGKLGDVKFIEADFGIVSPDDRRTHIKEYGGGAMLDVGVYVLQLLQFIWKEEPKKVTTVGSLYDSGVDLTETIILEYEGGKRAVLNIHTQLEFWSKATIYGSKGRVTLEQPFHFPHIVIDVDGKTKSFPLHSSKLPYNFTNTPGLVYQALEVARCNRAGLIESPRMTHQESINVAVLEDTVRKQLGVHFDADDKESTLEKRTSS